VQTLLHNQEWIHQLLVCVYWKILTGIRWESYTRIHNVALILMVGYSVLSTIPDFALAALQTLICNSTPLPRRCSVCGYNRSYQNPSLYLPEQKQVCVVLERSLSPAIDGSKIWHVIYKRVVVDRSCFDQSTVTFLCATVFDNLPVINHTLRRDSKAKVIELQHWELDGAVCVCCSNFVLFCPL